MRILGREGGVPIARRMVSHERGRFLVSVGGVAFTTLLMLFLFGTYEGVQRESNRYVEERPVHIWVSQDNSTNLIRSTSFLSEATGELIRGVAGVASGTALLRTIVTATIDGETATFFLLGFEPEAGSSTPTLVAGDGDLEDGEIIMDRALAARHDLTIGDSLLIQSRLFRVAGVSTGTNAVVTQFAFVTLTDAQAILGFPDIVSFWLIKVDPASDPLEVSRRLTEVVPGVNTFSQAAFAHNNLEEMRTGLLPILSTIAVMGALTGGAVLTLLLYGSVLEKRADYALVQAIGGSRRFIALLVARQALVVIVIGVVVGVTIHLVAAPAIERLVPGIALATTPSIIVAVAAAAALIGLGSTWLPIRRLGRVYPAEVFRE
jgi:putative ABC transport system permease protein